MDHAQDIYEITDWLKIRKDRWFNVLGTLKLVWSHYTSTSLDSRVILISQALVFSSGWCKQDLTNRSDFLILRATTVSLMIDWRGER